MNRASTGHCGRRAVAVHRLLSSPGTRWKGRDILFQCLHAPRDLLAVKGLLDGMPLLERYHHPGPDSNADARAVMKAIQDAAPRPTALLISTLALLSAVSPLATDMYLPSFPRIASDLGTSAFGVQLTLTAFMIGLGSASS